MKSLFIIKRAGGFAMIRGPNFTVFAISAAIARFDG